jgi:hypothetical protein
LFQALRKLNANLLARAVGEIDAALAYFSVEDPEQHHSSAQAMDCEPPIFIVPRALGRSARPARDRWLIGLDRSAGHGLPAMIDHEAP